MTLHGRILLLDQSQNIETLFRDGIILHNPGIDFSVSTNTQEASQELDRVPIDLCLCGLRLQNEGVQTFLQWLKESQHHEIPAVLISTTTDMDEANECLTMGVKEVIWQPFKMESLRSRVTSLLTNEVVKRKTRIESFI